MTIIQAIDSRPSLLLIIVLSNPDSQKVGSVGPAWRASLPVSSSLAVQVYSPHQHHPAEHHLPSPVN